MSPTTCAPASIKGKNRTCPGSQRTKELNFLDSAELLKKGSWSESWKKGLLNVTLKTVPQNKLDMK